MDTSETYIKMCEKATEIQTEWTPKAGDFCGHGNEGEEVFGNWEFPAQTDIVILDKHKTKEWWLHWLFLPRQDQLQEMVKKRNTRELLMRFTDWVEKDTDYRRESMEQLWLAFVMKGKYDKVWNGEDWN